VAVGAAGVLCGDEPAEIVGVVHGHILSAADSERRSG
jgi:hypothetical protein